MVLPGFFFHISGIPFSCFNSISLSVLFVPLFVVNLTGSATCVAVPEVFDDTNPGLISAFPFYADP